MTKNELHAALRAQHSIRYVICGHGHCLEYDTWEAGDDFADIHDKLEGKGWRFKKDHGGWVCSGCRVLIKAKPLKADARKEAALP